MKSKLTLLPALLILVFFNSTAAFCQSMGISSSAITPDPSAILEIRTTSKGMLIPRMTTLERNGIGSPANGLMLYNTDTNQYNFYNGSAWAAWGSAAYLSEDAGDTVFTSSTTDVVLPNMTKTAVEAGSYVVLFNSQVTIPEAFNTTGFSTSVAASDLNLILADINAIPATNTSHPLTFGLGERLFAGVYDIPGAASITANLILDGGGDPNALFMIRATGAFNTSASARVILENGATAKNVFWIADGAIGIGASTTLVGNLISRGSAVAVGATCVVNGRLLTTNGAISFGEGTLSVPQPNGIIDFRALTNFVIFTNAGGVANTGASIYTGDIGTNAGAITGFAATTVNGIIFPSGSSTTVSPVDHTVTFSLYKNSTLIQNSSRTRTRLTNPSDISLQGITSISVNDTIDVRWKIDDQDADYKEISATNRILTLIKVGN
jgi:hypothetical protein